MQPLTFLIFGSLLFYRAEAKNDWSQPCLGGTCSFDIARSNTSMAGTLSINGSSASISDITTAAGWSILNCSANTNNQTIQLICTDESKGCNHLFQQGAENTIVRLPEDCGTGPFARVVKHSVLVNQSLPADVVSKVRRNGSTSPQVQLLQIDTNFTDAASSGQTVDFSLVASTDPELTLPSTPFSDTVPGSSTIALDESFELFNNTFQSQTLSVGTTTALSFNAGYTFQVAGSLVPSSLRTFVATTTISGTFDASVSVAAQLTGTLDTGEIDLLRLGIPAISVPSILTIGPVFSLNAVVTGTVDLPASLSVGIQYALDGLNFTVGSSAATNAGFTSFDAPVQVSIDSTVSAQSSLEVDLIPTLSFGVNSFGESCTIVAGLESGLLISLDASGDGSTTGEVCADISNTYSFNVGATGNLFGIITNTLSESILARTINTFDECTADAADVTDLRSSSVITTRSEHVQLSEDGGVPSFGQLGKLNNP